MCLPTLSRSFIAVRVLGRGLQDGVCTEESVWISNEVQKAIQGSGVQRCPRRGIAVVDGDGKCECECGDLATSRGLRSWMEKGRKEGAPGGVGEEAVARWS
jgi:ribosomal protein L31E